VYHNLQTRLTKTLIHAFLDPAKSLTQHYGAVQGISALGSSAVEPAPFLLNFILVKYRLITFASYQIGLLLLPNLVTYMQLLEPELQVEKQKNEMKRKEAWRVYGALLVCSELSVNLCLRSLAASNQWAMFLNSMLLFFQCAAGKCLYDRLKLFPALLSPSTRPLLRSNKRVATNNPSKCCIYSCYSLFIAKWSHLYDIVCSCSLCSISTR
jgi:transcription initiation factor TFIID subunit 6